MYLLQQISKSYKITFLLTLNMQFVIFLAWKSETLEPKASCSKTSKDCTYSSYSLGIQRNLNYIVIFVDPVVLMYTPFFETLSLFRCLFKGILCERFPLSGRERRYTYVVCPCIELVINGLFESSHVFFIILG